MYVCKYVIATLHQPKLLIPGDTLEKPRALISGMEVHSLLAKHHDAAKDTGRYSYLKRNSTVYVALAILAW
jgi:hypothetical protein